MTNADKKFVLAAIEKAKESVKHGGFPAGAIVVKDSQIIGEGISLGNELNDPTSHGEMSAIREACRNIQSSDLTGAVLYSSMEPCVMCLGASMWGALSKVVFACSKNKVSAEYYGGEYHTANINLSFLHPIELAHFSELEAESLAVVRHWEEFSKN